MDAAAKEIPTGAQPEASVTVLKPAGCAAVIEAQPAATNPGDTRRSCGRKREGSWGLRGSSICPGKIGKPRTRGRRTSLESPAARLAAENSNELRGEISGGACSAEAGSHV